MGCKFFAQAFEKVWMGKTIWQPILFEPAGCCGNSHKAKLSKNNSCLG
jgi:hypothetical protein